MFVMAMGWGVLRFWLAVNHDREPGTSQTVASPPASPAPTSLPNVVAHDHHPKDDVSSTRRRFAETEESDILAEAEELQRMAMGAADPVVAVVIQELAERGIPPRELIHHVLATDGRGVTATCFAWYGARLTMAGDPGLAVHALAGLDTAITEATKTAFDYLAASDNRWLHTDPDLREQVVAWGQRFGDLPPDADIVPLAAADAYLRALPALLPPPDAADELLDLLSDAESAEVKLSALEQLVSLQVTGAAVLTRELQMVQHRLPELFPDPVKQVRAKLRLQRLMPTDTKVTS